MNSLSNQTAALQLCVCACLMVVASSLSSQTASDALPPVPPWIEKRQDLLPPITMNDFMRMKTAWENIQISDVEFNPPPRFWEGLETIVDMGEKAVQALIWLYIQDPPRLNPNLGVRDEYLIRTVFLDDPTSVRWVLPLLRYRLQWMEGLLARGEHEHLLRLCDELGAIQGYINIRGDERDYRNVMAFINKLSLLSDKFNKKLGIFIGPGYDAAVDESRRITRRQQLFPYHEWAKLALASRNDTAQHSGNAETPMAQGSSTNLKPLSTTKVAGIKQQVPNYKQPSSTSWSVVFVVCVALISLLWLLLKKRK